VVLALGYRLALGVATSIFLCAHRKGHSIRGLIIGV
jgi:hypothetical protein